MKSFMFFLLTLSNISQAMDAQKQLKKQLLDIAFNGQYDAFAQQREAFTKELDHSDFHRAHWRCSCRLLALKSLSAMEKDPRIKDLVVTMQKEFKRYKYGIFAYIAEASENYKKNNGTTQEDVFNIAANIINDIELRATGYIGNYMVDLMTKLAQEQRPLTFLKKEKCNTRRLQEALQQTMLNKPAVDVQ